MTMAEKPTTTPTAGRLRFPHSPAVSTAEDAFARVVLLLLLVKVPHFSFVPAAAFLGIAFLPAGWSSLRRAPALRWLLVCTPIAILAGVITRAATVPSLAQPKGFGVAFDMAIWAMSFPALLGLGLWAIERIGVRKGLALILVGALVDQVVLSSSGDWKGTIGIYLTALLLLLFARNTPLTVLTLLASAAYSAVNDARFMAIVGVLSVFAMFVSRTPKVDARHRRRGTVQLIVSLLVAAVTGIWCMAAGLFGQSTQQRTLDQLSHPAFIIADARVEWAATAQLFSRVPYGFGINVVPVDELQREAVDAIQQAGGDYTSPYFRTVVFGERVDLHSMLADLWFHFGLGGVLLFAVMATMLISAIYLSTRARASIGLCGTYTILIGCWDLLFSPMGNSDRLVFALLCAAILLIGYRDAGAADPDLRSGARQGSRPNIQSSAASLLS